MKEKIVSFELAKLANEIGFLDKTAPTLSLLQRWLLKEKNIFVEILYDYEYDSTLFHFDVIDINKHESMMKEDWSADDTEYDEALEHGLIYCLNLLKEK